MMQQFLTKKKRYIWLMFLSVSTAFSAVAQQSVSGKVTEENNEGLPGVSIVLKGASTGTITDIEGDYKLTIPEELENPVLTFSFVGYLPQDVAIGNRNTVDVALQPDIKSLDEVIVVGYGTTTRQDLTTSVAKVDPKKIPTAANANINDLLVGRAPGLRVTQQSAQPGGNIDLTIRGRVEDPLIVVDGVVVPYTGLEPGVNFAEINNVNRGGLAGLNPNDIESIEVLKDGAASMYGIGAAGGVILITTKKGIAGRINVSYNASHSIQKNMDYIEPLGPAAYMQYFNRFTQDQYLADSAMVPFGNSPAAGVPEPFSQADIAAAAGPGTDWLGLVLRDGRIDNHSVSISGGTEKVTYYFSGNYFNQIGTVENSEMRKYNGRADLSFKLNEWLTVNTNVIANRNNFVNTVAGWQTGGAGANGFTALQSALSYPTYLPIRDPNTGELTRFQLRGNPVGLLDIDDETEYNSLYANLSLDFTIIPDRLTAKVLYGNNYESSYRDFFIPSTTNWFDDYRARASLSWQKRQQQTLEAYATFTEEVGDFLDINVVAGFGQYINDGNGFGLQATDMLDAINTSSVGAGQGNPLVNSNEYKEKKRSYFARGSFDFLDRYILSGSFRYDGFSQFFPGSKYAGFPSASVAWKISNETFLSNSNVIDLLKLRASVGTLGNASGFAYAAYEPDGDHVSFDGGATSYVPYLLTQLDRDLQWQKTVNKTIGLDFGIFDNRISGSIDWFREDVTRMLVEVNAPALSFLGSQFVNGRHQVRNGIELGLNTDNIRTPNFTWSSTVNISNYSFRWEERYVEDDIPSYVGIKDPVNALYTFETDGILQLGQEVPAWQPEAAVRPGSPLFVDQTGDSQLDSADVSIYDQIPKVSISLGNTFRYKNFDLSVFLYGQFGAYRPNFSLGWTDPLNLLTYGSAGTQDMDLVWSSENPGGTLPGATYNEALLGTIGNVSGVGSDVRITKTNFVRARNITLGYTFTSPSVKKIIDDLRVYVDVQNAFVITDYKGADPEVADRGVKGAPAPYPMVRTFSFGINANF